MPGFITVQGVRGGGTQHIATDHIAYVRHINDEWTRIRVDGENVDVLGPSDEIMLLIKQASAQIAGS